MLIYTPQYIYNQLEREAEIRLLPEAYVTDLTKHDRNALESTGTQHFIWVLRTCGTHLLRLDELPAKSYNYPHYLIDAFVGMGDKDMLFFEFKDGKLTELSRDEAKRASEAAMAHLRRIKELERKLEIERLYKGLTE